MVTNAMLTLVYLSYPILYSYKEPNYKKQNQKKKNYSRHPVKHLEVRLGNPAQALWGRFLFLQCRILLAMAPHPLHDYTHYYFHYS